MAPLYQFTNEAGEEVEVLLGMDEAPEVGSTIEVDGQKLTRQFSTQGGIVKNYAHVSHSLPRVKPSDPYWKKFDGAGRPVFTSKRDVEELTARIGHMGGRFAYD